jgi:RHS repeat-associated protein
MGLNHIDKTMKTQHVWGSRHIDDAVMMRTDTNDDGTWDHEFYYATDAQFSTLALLDSAGTVHERTRYTPYGEARHSWGNDVDSDGDADSADRSAITSITVGTTIGSAGYRAECDLDRNGKIEVADATKWDNMGGATSALASGMVSDAKDPYAGSPENAIGYAGYLFNPDEETYAVRHRTYHPDRKRWLQRDPAGYVDGPNLSQYVRSNPIVFSDIYGLDADTGISGSYSCSQAWSINIDLENLPSAIGSVQKFLNNFGPRISAKGGLKLERQNCVKDCGPGCTKPFWYISASGGLQLKASAFAKKKVLIQQVSIHGLLVHLLVLIMNWRMELSFLEELDLERVPLDTTDAMVHTSANSVSIRQCL